MTARRMIVSDVDERISDGTFERVLLPALARQLDEGGCTCSVVHAVYSAPAVGVVEASVGHDGECPMKDLGDVGEETAHVRGGLN